MLEWQPQQNLVAHRLLTASARPCTVLSNSHSWRLYFLLGLPTVRTGGPAVVVGGASGGVLTAQTVPDHLVPATPPSHPVQECLFIPTVVRGLNYLTCHSALPRFISAAVQVSECQTAVSAPVHRPQCRRVRTGGSLMGGLSGRVARAREELLSWQG